MHSKGEAAHLRFDAPQNIKNIAMNEQRPNDCKALQHIAEIGSVSRKKQQKVSVQCHSFNVRKLKATAQQEKILLSLKWLQMKFYKPNVIYQKVGKGIEYNLWFIYPSFSDFTSPEITWRKPHIP